MFPTMSNYVHNIDIFIIPYLRGKYNRGRHIFVGFLSYFCIRKEDILANVLCGIRRRPTLPGRFQPSTISVLRLNFCVRDGNRWDPQAIVTGNQAELGGDCCRLSGIDASAIELPRVFLPSSRLQLSLSAPSKPHRLEIRFPSDQDFFLLSLETFFCFPQTTGS